jgi:hypothetical protein
LRTGLKKPFSFAPGFGGSETTGPDDFCKPIGGNTKKQKQQAENEQTTQACFSLLALPFSSFAISRSASGNAFFRRVFQVRVF